MDSSFGYLQTRRALGFAVLGLATVGGWLRTSYAQEPVALPLLTQSSQDEANQHTAQLSSAEVDTLAVPNESGFSHASYSAHRSRSDDFDWLTKVRFGYDQGFVLASERQLNLGIEDSPFVTRINGWGQVRHTVLDSDGLNPDLNQFQLKRARLVLGLLFSLCS